MAILSKLNHSLVIKVEDYFSNRNQTIAVYEIFGDHWDANNPIFTIDRNETGMKTRPLYQSKNYHPKLSTDMFDMIDSRKLF